MNFNLEIGNFTHVGKSREVNEDYFGVFSGDFGNIIVVCDGMGGHKGGELASRISVEAIKSHFEFLAPDFVPQSELISALTKADQAILKKAKEEPELIEMGSTAAVLLLKDGMVYTANIGDSRIYLIRNNQICQLTKDHSLVQQMLDANMISSEAAKNHPQRNVITRSLGAFGFSEPDIEDPFPSQVNDIYVICSDGLNTHVEDNEILNTVELFSPQEACIKMVELCNERGGKDNITIQVVKVLGF
jgi:protein phosphatase